MPCLEAGIRVKQIGAGSSAVTRSALALVLAIVVAVCTGAAAQNVSSDIRVWTLAILSILDIAFFLLGFRRVWMARRHPPAREGAYAHARDSKLARLLTTAPFLGVVVYGLFPHSPGLLGAVAVFLAYIVGMFVGAVAWSAQRRAF